LGIISILSLAGALAGSGVSLPGTSTENNTAARGGPGAIAAPTRSSASQPIALATPTIPASVPTPTPMAASQLVTTHDPLVLLSPSSARPGSTVGVTGSGLTAGTTVDVYLKHKLDDQGKSLGFVQAVKSGSFGGFNLTLPSDFASGPFIVLVQEHI